MQAGADNFDVPDFLFPSLSLAAPKKTWKSWNEKKICLIVVLIASQTT